MFKGKWNTQYPRTLDGVGLAHDLNDRTIVEVVREESGVDGRRHEDHPQLRVSSDHVTKYDQDEVSLRGERASTLIWLNSKKCGELYYTKVQEVYLPQQSQSLGKSYPTQPMKSANGSKRGNACATKTEVPQSMSVEITYSQTPFQLDMRSRNVKKQYSSGNHMMQSQR